MLTAIMQQHCKTNVGANLNEIQEACLFLEIHSVSTHSALHTVPRHASGHIDTASKKIAVVPFPLPLSRLSPSTGSNQELRHLNSSPGVTLTWWEASVVVKA